VNRILEVEVAGLSTMTGQYILAKTLQNWRSLRSSNVCG